MFVAQVLIAIIAILHLYFLILEMFLWDKPLGMKAFGNTVEKAKLTKVLAQNQGLYNGFLAAGLIWSLFASAPFAIQLANFFLGCVLVAGLWCNDSKQKDSLYSGDAGIDCFNCTKCVLGSAIGISLVA